jgi:ferric-dicitrate binding protein FerR (iron transport regulator)
MRAITASLVSLALAGTLSAGPVGVITSVSGKVSLFNASAADKAKDLKLGQQLVAGDRLKTGANGRAALVLIDGTQMKINYSTDITLRDKDTKGKSSDRGVASIKIALGELWAKVTKKNSRLEFDTPAAVAAVKGTEPIFTVDEKGNLCAKLREGKLDISNEMGGVSLTELQQICVAPHQKPQGVVKYDPKDDKGFDSTMVGASKATVEILFNDEAGNVKKAVIEYEKE